MSEDANLELRVTSDVDSAIKKLNDLKGALSSLLSVQVSGKNLEETAQGVNRLVNSLNSAVTDESVKKISKLSLALKRLQQVGVIDKNFFKLKQPESESQQTLEALSSDIRANVGGAFEEASSDAQAALGNVNSKVGEVRRAVSEFAEATDATTTSFQHMDSKFDLQSAKSKIELLQDKLHQLKDELREGISTGKFDDKKITDYSIRIANLQERIENMSAPANAAKSAFDGFGESLQRSGRIVSSVSSALRTLLQSLARITRTGFSAVASGIQNLFSGIKNVTSGIRSGIGKAGKVFDEFRNRISLSHTALGKLISSIQRIALYRVIRAGIKMVTEAVKEGVDNLYKWSSVMNGSFAASMDMGSNAALNFKNSIGAMLAPAIEAVLPLLVQLANVAIMAANAINQFLSALFGRSTWTRANNAVKNAGAGLKGAGGAAKKADDELKGLLADWDELNIIQNETKDNASGGGGGGGGMADEFADMFSIENLPTNQWTELATRIREAILAGDWYGAGEAIAEKINELVGQFDAVALGKKLKSWIVNGLDFMNGLIENTDFVQIGQKIGDFLGQIFSDDGNGIWTKLGINIKLRMFSILDTMKGVFSKKELFTSVGDSLSKLVESFFKFTPEQVETIAGVFGDSIKLITSNASTLFDETDFKGIGVTLGNTLRRTIESIDWAGIGEAFRKGFMSIIELVRGIMAGSDKEFDDAKRQLASSIIPRNLDEMVGDAPKAGFGSLGDSIAESINSLFNLSSEDIHQAAEFLGDGIKSIADNAKNTFAKTDFEGIGTKVSEFLASIFGGKDKGGSIDWTGIGETLREGVKAPFRLLAGIFSGDGEKPEGFPDVGGAIAEMINGFFDFDEKDINGAAKAVGSAIAKVFLNVKGAIEQTDWDNIIAGFGQFLADLDWEKIFTAAKDAIIAAATTVFNSLDTLWRYLKYILHNAFGGLINSIMGDTVPIFETIEDYEAYTNSAYGLKYGFRKNESGKYEIDPEFSAFDSLYATAIEDFNNALTRTGYTYEGFLEALNDPAIANSPGILYLKEYYDTYLKLSGVSDIKSPYSTMEDSAQGMADALEEANVQFDELIDKEQNVHVPFAVDPADVIDNTIDEQGLEMKIDSADAQDLASQIEAALANIEIEAPKFSTDDQYWDEVLAPMIQQLAQENGSTDEAGKKLADSLKADFANALNSDDWDAGVATIMEKIKQAISELGIDDSTLLGINSEEVSDTAKEVSGAFEEITGAAKEAGAALDEARIDDAIPTELPAPDISAYSASISNAANATTSAANEAIRALSAWASAEAAVFGGSYRSSSNKVLPKFTSVHKFASGGFPTTGEMFIARESGPEMVGTMGGKTAVANNDQIVSGVSAGVAAGQAEQNALLRQQNDYLRRILEKETTINFKPSSDAGKWISRSSDMYARNTGVAR